jgi:hypothetical protein
MRDAYHAFCELWVSLEYQEKLAKKRKSGSLLEHTHLGPIDASVGVNEW